MQKAHDTIDLTMKKFLLKASLTLAAIVMGCASASAWNMNEYVVVDNLRYKVMAGPNDSGDGTGRLWFVGIAGGSLSETLTIPEIVQNTETIDGESKVVDYIVVGVQGAPFQGAGFSEIVLPKTVVSKIDNLCFSNCQNLEKVTVGSPSSFGFMILTGCPKLTDVTCLATEPPAANDMTFGIETADYEKITLHVPAGSAEKYRNAEGWKLFAKKISGVNDIAVDNNGEEVYYNLQGVKVAEPVEGQIYIMVKDGKAQKVVK